MIVDFHSHTYFSDGGLSPVQVHELMRKRGVAIYAITDHDTLGAHELLTAESKSAADGLSGRASLSETDTAGEAEPLRVVGVEINTTYANNEVHILGYGFAASGSSLDTVLAENRRLRLLRVEQMVEQLNAANISLTVEEVWAAAENAQSIGRPHVARALVRRGLASDVSSAIKRWFRRGGIGYVPSQAITPFEAIEAIHAAGGTAVLAHPCRLDDFGLIEVFARAGIDGLEVFYPRHTDKQTIQFRAEAARFGLVASAGADFHDSGHNPRGVGMDVSFDDLQPFLERIVPAPALAQLQHDDGRA